MEFFVSHYKYIAKQVYQGHKQLFYSGNIRLINLYKYYLDFPL